MTSNKKQKARYKINQIVKYENCKAKVLDAWWDGREMFRYEIKFMIGKNLAGDFQSVPEHKLSLYE